MRPRRRKSYCIIPIRRERVTREYYAPDISSIEQWREKARKKEREGLDREPNTRISSLPRSVLASSICASRHYQEDGIPDIMCHVKSSYAFRTVKLLFILGTREHGASGQERDRKRERRQRRRTGVKNVQD